jgi:hypothetical protein
MQFLLPLLLKVTLVAVIGRLAIAAMPRASASKRYLIAVTTRNPPPVWRRHSCLRLSARTRVSVPH